MNYFENSLDDYWKPEEDIKNLRVSNREMIPLHIYQGRFYGPITSSVFTRNSKCCCESIFGKTMKVYQLMASGEGCMGNFQKMYSRNVFESKEDAEEYIPEWKELITDREQFLYLEDNHLLKIEVMVLVFNSKRGE